MYAKNKELFLLSIVIFLTVVAWIIVDIYHIQQNANFVVDYQKSANVVIKKINSKDLIDKLGKRK